MCCSRCGSTNVCTQFSWSGVAVNLCVECDALACKRFGEEDVDGENWLALLGWGHSDGRPFPEELEKFLKEVKDG